MSDPNPETSGDVKRCAWSNRDVEIVYHDHEWGRPTTDPNRLFEKICLEGFQSGLSWLTILNKRERFREVFAGFDYVRVAEFGEDDLLRLLDDAGIIRHRGKIEATINNAQRAVELIEETGSLVDWIWEWALPEPFPAGTPIPATTPRSEALAKELKRRGWRFFGPTTAYAFMQSEGLTNDHDHDCLAFEASEEERQAFLAGRTLRP